MPAVAGDTERGRGENNAYRSTAAGVRQAVLEALIKRARM
jgi:hypothetical protein